MSNKQYTGTITFSGCTRVIIDIDGKLGTGGGVDWKDSQGTDHPNAISVSNFCYITSLKLKTGDRITFGESATDITNTPPCLTVLCIMDGPKSDVFVHGVKKVEGEN